MGSRHLLLASALVLVTATPVLAQRGGGRGGGRGALARALENPITFLMEQEELGLTEEQKVELTLVADTLTAQNAEGVAQVQEAMSGGRGRAVFQALQPVLTAINEKNDAAVAKAMALLTEDQKPVAERLLAERAAQGRRGRRGGGGPS